jgi:voltage-gated potassium channel
MNGRWSALFVKVANSPGRLLIAFVVLIVSASLVYGIVEDGGFLNAIYWSIITATTLGYGDFSPHTTAGKCLRPLSSVRLCSCSSRPSPRTLPQS